MMIAATKPTIPASPKDCTKPIMFDAIPLTKGTFPPSRLTTIPNASRDITTFVRLSKIDVSPAIAFMFSPIYFTMNQNESFRIDIYKFIISVSKSTLKKFNFIKID